MGTPSQGIAAPIAYYWGSIGEYLARSRAAARVPAARTMISPTKDFPFVFFFQTPLVRIEEMERSARAVESTGIDEL